MDESTSITTPLDLASEEAHVWYVRPERLTDPAWLARGLERLSSDERRRQARYRFARDRHMFLVAHTFVRTLLSRYADVEPAEWQFKTNNYGRPEIEFPRELARLRFNLTHTPGLVVCGVTWKRDIGVDAEDMMRQNVGIKIARRFFSPSEVAALEQVAPEYHRSAFYDYWTLKESYIKARGMGLAIPLDHFSFDLSDRRNIRIRFDPRLSDDPASWQFNQFIPTPRHKIALALRRGTHRELRTTVLETIPAL